MPIVGDATIVVDADTGPFDRNLKTNATKSASGVGTVIKGILGAAVVTQGARAGLDFLKSSIEEGREAVKVGNLTAAVIKSTGGAAGLSASQFGELANKLSALSGVDDEVIQSSENVLATFTKVQNKAGAGNKIFDEAALAALNMSKALGTDLQGATLQVGKALNDPIKGITALSRAGVSFTEAQKKQITTLVESGKTLEAQKLILKELGTEFGGAAAASTNSGERLKVTFDNIKESIGLKLLPILDKVSTFLADKLPGALDAAGAAAGRIGQILEPIIGGIRETIGVLFAGDFTGVGPFAEDSPFIASLFNLRDQLLPIVQQFASFIQDNLKPILIGLGIAALVIAGPFIAIGAAFVAAYLKSQTFRDIVGGVITTVIGFVQSIVEFVQTNLPKFQEAFEHVANAVVAVWNQMKGTIIPVVEAVINTIIAIVGRIVAHIEQVVLFVTNIINGDFGAAFGNLKKIVSNVIGTVLDIITGLGPSIAGLVVGVVSSMASLGFDIIKGLVRGIRDKAGDVIGAIKKFVLDKVPGFVKKFFGIDSPSKMFAGFGRNLMEGLAAGIRSGAGSPLDALAAATGALGQPLGVGGTTGGFGTGARPAASSRSVTFGDINVHEVAGSPDATAFAVMAKVAGSLNL